MKSGTDKKTDNIQVNEKILISNASRNIPELEAYLSKWLYISAEKLLNRMSSDKLERLTPELNPQIASLDSNTAQKKRARYYVCKTSLSREASRQIKAAALKYMGLSKVKALFSELYLRHLSALMDIRWEEVSNLLCQSYDSVFVKRAFMEFSKIVNEEQRKSMMSEYLARKDFESKLHLIGIQNFSLLKENSEKEFNFAELEQKALIDYIENIIEPMPNLSFDEIAQRQGNLMGLYSDAKLLYTSTQSISISNALKNKGYNSLSLIPWRFAEAPVFVEAKEDIKFWIIGTVLGFQFLSELYKNPKNCAAALGYQPHTDKYYNLLKFYGMLHTVLDWKVPGYLPSPKNFPSLDLSLTAFIRPDYAIEKTAEGMIKLIATEIENAPGGMGKQEIVFAGYPQMSSNLMDTLYKFMQETKLPKSMTPNFNRNKLTILTSEEWIENKTEYVIFLNLFRTKYDIETAIFTIEELIKNKETEKIKNGFVYHLAYPWVFLKETDKFYINILLKPQDVASFLGYPLESIIKNSFVKDEAVKEKELKQVIDNIKNEFKKTVNQSISIFPDVLCKNLLKVIYCDEILNILSKNSEFLDMNIQEIGHKVAANQNDALYEIYKQQGRDLFIFNDPAMGRLVYTKTGIACLHLPQFIHLFSDYLNAKNFDSKAIAKITEIVVNMNAKTVPLIGDASVSGEEKSRPEIKELLDYTLKIIDDAKSPHGREEWILKLCIDPYLSYFDWGARGIWVGKETSQEKWEEIISKAIQSNVPFVLQKLVNHIKFCGYRREKRAKELHIRHKISSYKKVGIFQNNPNNSDFGKLRLTETSIRINSFMFAINDINHCFQVFVPDGYATFTPCRGKNKMEKVHFTSHSSCAPVKFI